MEEIGALALLLDSLTQQIQEQQYIDAMNLLAAVHQKIRVMQEGGVRRVAGECGCAAANDIAVMRETNRRLKRTLRNRKRRWNRGRQLLLEQIDALNNEIAYLQQFTWRT